MLLYIISSCLLTILLSCASSAKPAATFDAKSYLQVDNDKYA